jgi:hypothetical protein
MGFLFVFSVPCAILLRIVIATCLQKIGDYVRASTSGDSLADALQDTCLALCIDQAVQSGQTVRTAAQAWMREPSL